MQYFGVLLPNDAATKSTENYLRKSCSALALKLLVKLTPVANVIKQIPW